MNQSEDHKKESFMSKISNLWQKRNNACITVLRDSTLCFYLMISLALVGGSWFMYLGLASVALGSIFLEQTLGDNQPLHDELKLGLGLLLVMGALSILYFSGPWWLISASALIGSKYCTDQDTMLLGTDLLVPFLVLIAGLGSMALFGPSFFICGGLVAALGARGLHHRGIYALARLIGSETLFSQICRKLYSGLADVPLCIALGATGLVTFPGSVSVLSVIGMSFACCLMIDLVKDRGDLSQALRVIYQDLFGIPGSASRPKPNI